MGLRRSGNHVVQHWLLKQSGKNIFYYNDSFPESPYNITRSKHSYETIHTKPLDEIDIRMVSFEDHVLRYLVNPVKVRPLKDSEQIKADSNFKLLLLRDPYNLFASRFKKKNKSGKKMIHIADYYYRVMTLSDLWISYAEEFLGKTNYLGQNKILVDYNKWIANVSYRKSLAHKLNLNFSDQAFDSVPEVGGGSSFDGTSISGTSLRKSVTERWKTCQDNEEYLKLFQDRRIVDLADRIFGRTPELDMFIKEKLEKRFSQQAVIKRQFRVHVLAPAFLNTKRAYHKVSSERIRHVVKRTIKPLLPNIIR